MNQPLTFGQIVKERRQALGLTQAELARRVGCATITIRKIEYDSLRPSVQIAERLALALSIPEAEQLAFVRLARAEKEVSPLPDPPPAPEEVGRHDLSGRAVRGYQLGERLGAGGFGAVYRAVQTTVEREVAVKLILPQYADHPDFIRNFEAEAQLVARLEHPHIVPLYDFWREPGAAYLVMRLLSHGSLEDRLAADGPLPPEILLALLDQLGTALHSAHRAGVIHRDIKPANILLDADGNAYLADFGIAKDLELAELSRGGAVVGSPAYFSPEQIQAEPVKPQSDIYCLGIMLFELLTGHRPFSGPSPIAYIQQHLADSLPPLATARPGLPPALDDVLNRATAKRIADRYPDVPALLADFRQAVDGHVGAAPTPPALPAIDVSELTNPYKGLQAFAEADADDFFGRDTLVQALLGRLSEETDLSRFLAVVGPSGSGKSSVVRAGLLPALRRGGLPGSEQWFITDMIPGARPLEELEAALLRVAVNPPDTLLEQLRADERGLLRAINRILPPDPAVELVLVVDQFEELFTLPERETARRRFLDSLVTALLDERSRLRLIVTLRADFVDRPLRYVDFGELLRQRTEFVLPLSPDELEAAIVQPATRHGLVLEPGLAADIIRDVDSQPGSLPLLQYALTELFEQRDGRRLTRAAYQVGGGVSGALARRAEEIFLGLDGAGRDIARQMFLRLVTPGDGAEDTRRRALRTELVALNGATENPASGELPGSAPITQVLNQFGRYRLLTFDRDPASRAPTVEVAHEALLREWQRLGDWLAGSRADIRLQRLLAAAAAEWQQAGQDDGFLLTGARLAQFEAWAGESSVALTPGEQRFLDASLAARQAWQAAEEARLQRELETAQKLAQTEAARAEEQSRAAGTLRRRALYLTGVLVVAGLLAVAAALFGQQARANARQAQANFTRAEAQRLAAEANTLVQSGGNAELIALLAVKSLGLEYTPQGDAALQSAAGLDYPQRILRGGEGSLWAVDFSPDSRRLVTGNADGTARLWDVASGEQLQEFAGHEDEVVTVAFAPDGKSVLTGSYDQTARLWDVETGQELQQFAEPESSYVVAVYSPDGQTVLTGTGGGGKAHLWRVGGGQPVQTFAPGDEVSGVAVSPDGRLAALTSGPNLTVWDIQTGEQRLDIEAGTDLLIDVVFSPDGRLLASGGYDAEANLWDAAGGEHLQTFSGHFDAVEKVRFSPDGNTLLTVSDDRTARLWDVETGQEIRQLAGHDSPIFGADFAPDGHTIATASFDQTAKLWAAQSQPEWPELAGVIGSAFANAIAVSPDGRLALGAGESGLRLWDLQSGQVAHQFEHGPPMLSAAFGPDGRQAWGGGADGVLVGWDVGTGELLQSLSGHQAEIVSVAISPDGQFALTAGASDGTARLWDLQRGAAAQVFSPEAGFVLDVAFSADGQFALASTAGGTVFMWSVADGQLARQFQLDGPTGAPSVAVSPDGAQVVVGTRFGDVVWFNADSGRRERVFSGHTDVVRDLAFSADGTWLLSASADGTARLWDTATGAELRRFDRQPFTVHSAVFAPDGRSVLVAAGDGVVRRLDVAQEETVNYLCGRLQRDFSVAERARYELDAGAVTCP